MVLGANGVVWMGGEEEEEDAISSWTRNNNNDGNANNEFETKEDDLAMSAASLSSFKSMLDADCLLLHHQIDSSASCSPSQAFTLDPSQSHPLLPPKSCFSSLLNISCHNPFDNAFDFASEPAFLAQFQPNPTPNLMAFPQTQMGTPEFSSSSEFQGTRLFAGTENASPLSGGFSAGGFDGSGNVPFVNRAKTLKPLEVFPSVGSQPTLFQKRAAMRQGSGGSDKLGNLDVSELRFGGEASDGKRKRHGELILRKPASITVTGGGDQKGKKKGMPAKNLMAERRRRKKLNDRLYMLRSVVPKISKVEVRVREGRAVNIHMFCARRPGLLLSTMRALDNLGLDIQQAVISCFNGFALDVFRAEQCREEQELMAEQIKAVLLDSAGFHGIM
ncbi:hypothetical protein ERO13_D11G067800v2 [Gossypium hirsutum]|nr:hypothetical protein ERO13_D11G067800v2 [Gossypium hirsutum]